MSILPDPRCRCTIQVDDAFPKDGTLEEMIPHVSFPRSMDCGVPSHAIEARDARIAELETEIERLKKAAPEHFAEADPTEEIVPGFFPEENQG